MNTQTSNASNCGPDRLTARCGHYSLEARAASKQRVPAQL